MKLFNKDNFNLNKWYYLSYQNNNIKHIFNIQEYLVIPSANYFINQVIDPLLDKGSINNNLRINIIVKFYNGISYKSITTVKTLDIKNIKELGNIITFYYIKNYEENYNLDDFNAIVFNFRIISHELIPNNKAFILNEENRNDFYQEKFSQKISNINLPLTMDLYQWGNINFSGNFNIAKMEIDNNEYHFTLYNNYYICNVMTKNDVKLLTFKDTLLNKEDLSNFKREIINKGFTKKLFIYNNFEIIFKANKHKPKFLKKVNKVGFITKKFLTLDIETKVINNKLEAICISIFDGKKIKSFFVTDYDDKKDMLEQAIKYLIRPKYNNYKIYAHNFAMFDAIFLLNTLTKLTDSFNVKNRDGVLIEIICKFNNITLTFRDSYLLLPSSLDNLAKSFINDNKEYFPYDFVNNTELNYEGVVPSKNYFTNITLEDYENYCKLFKNKKWNLKNETIKYCESDVILLYNIIRKFHVKIFNSYFVDILKYPTLPSLAFAIYRSNFLNEYWNIPIIEGKIYEFISKSYTGGHVDLYYHSNDISEKVYRYDINSLYPYCMSKYPMPTGFPIEFEGDILNNEIYEIVADSFNLKKRYGFFECEISAPENLFIPILLKREKIDGLGYRTIAPVGNWKGVYFSEELENSKKYGYQYTTNKGYLFNNENIFKGYVEELYKMKCNSKKNDPDYIISKLLLNSLYGRFGMKPEYLTTKIVTDIELDILMNSNIEIYDKIDLEDKYLISFFPEYEDNKLLKNLTNVNVAIASSITSLSRQEMAFYKYLEGYKVFYSDTDSIDLNKPLDDKFIGKELGQMKLEHIWEKAIYISNKAYIGIDKAGNSYRKLRGVKVKSKEFLNNPIEFEDLKKLLYKDSELNIPQERWFKSFKNNNIETRNINFKLCGNDNKRISIIENGIKTYTLPIKLNK